MAVEYEDLLIRSADGDTVMAPSGCNYYRRHSTIGQM